MDEDGRRMTRKPIFILIIWIEGIHIFFWLFVIFWISECIVFAFFNCAWSASQLWFVRLSVGTFSCKLFGCDRSYQSPRLSRSGWLRHAACPGRYPYRTIKIYLHVGRPSTARKWTHFANFMKKVEQRTTLQCSACFHGQCDRQLALQIAALRRLTVFGHLYLWWGCHARPHSWSYLWWLSASIAHNFVSLTRSPPAEESWAAGPVPYWNEQWIP